jgi:hypothetical protein
VECRKYTKGVDRASQYLCCTQKHSETRYICKILLHSTT